MRQRVDQQRIELFLQQLGRQFTKPGRVYLVGGTIMVYEGLRQQTLDIDLALEIEGFPVHLSPRKPGLGGDAKMVANASSSDIC